MAWRAQRVRVWPTVHQERRALAADLERLTADEWRTASLCPGWDVHDVLAHLVDTARTSRLSFVRDMAAARGDFDLANARGIAREKRPDARDTLAALREVADLTRTPPAAAATRLVEAIVHGEDIRRPLGMAGTYPPSAVAQALEHQLRTSVAFGGGRQRAQGLTLVDSLTGASWGQGDNVEGAAVDLLLAVSGRAVPASRLTGRGGERLLARLAQ